MLQTLADNVSDSFQTAPESVSDNVRQRQRQFRTVSDRFRECFKQFQTAPESVLDIFKRVQTAFQKVSDGCSQCFRQCQPAPDSVSDSSRQFQIALDTDVFLMDLLAKITV